MIRAYLVLAIAVALPSMLAAQAKKVFYTESFRHGSTLVTEESFDVKLTPQDMNYKERVKDNRGEDRYLLKIVPQGPIGDNKVTSWKVEMADLRHAIYPNVLITSPNPTSDPADVLGWLNPEKYSPVPAKSKRIIKIDSFYLVLEVTAFHFTPTESPYLDSMAVKIQLTNTDPRTTSP